MRTGRVESPDGSVSLAEWRLRFLFRVPFWFPLVETEHPQFQRRVEQDELQVELALLLVLHVLCRRVDRLALDLNPEWLLKSDLFLLLKPGGIFHLFSNRRSR